VNLPLGFVNAQTAGLSSITVCEGSFDRPDVLDSLDRVRGDPNVRELNRICQWRRRLDGFRRVAQAGEGCGQFRPYMNAAAFSRTYRPER
jgi:hypothetical protein